MKLHCIKFNIEIKDIFKEHNKCHRPICAGCQNLFDVSYEADPYFDIEDAGFTICDLDTDESHGEVVESYSGSGPYGGGEYVEIKYNCEYRKTIDGIDFALCTYDEECDQKD